MKKTAGKIFCVVGSGMLSTAIFSMVMMNPYHIGLAAGFCALWSLDLFKDA